MKKKVLAILVTAAMVCGLAACGNSADGNNSSAKADGGDKDGTYRVGICQLVQHESLDAATQGFEDALEEEFGTNVEFDLQNAQNDSNTCSTIINSFVSGDVDLILANATASLQAAAAGTNEIRFWAHALPSTESLSDLMILTAR